MLLDSPRLTSRDRQVWAERSRGDIAYSRTAGHRRNVDEASAAIRAFVDKGPCYAGVSWGKDSTVLAHMVATMTPSVPLVWVRIEPARNPDCSRVRDAFLQRWPITYVEHETTLEGTIAEDFAAVEAKIGRVRYLSGVRAQESSARRMRLQYHGLGGVRSCAPLSRWRGEDVFAYLAVHDLPIHPTYAMSMGGVLDRCKLRVDRIGGEGGIEYGRREWEERYYPDVIRQIEERE